MQRRIPLLMLSVSLLAATLACLATNARCQSLDSILNAADKAHIDLAALHVAQLIQEAKLSQTEPKVLVIDFFRDSAGNSSLLGTLLADRFSESLSNFSRGPQVLNRKIFKDYMTKEWMEVSELHSNKQCLELGREFGATEVIIGLLSQNGDSVDLTVHLAGFGPAAPKSEILEPIVEIAHFPKTEQLVELLAKPAPNFTRNFDPIPNEPGVLSYNDPGVSQPGCIRCPDPQYSDAARKAKMQGRVVLSVVVTTEGRATSIYLVKGAPMNLTAQAISAVKSWEFRPAQKDGKAVSVRVPIEMTFRLF